MVMSDLDRQATGAPEVPERTEPDECDHPTLYMQSWRGVEAFDGCLFCQRDEARSKLHTAVEALRECKRLAEQSGDGFLEDSPRWLNNIYCAAHEALKQLPEAPKP
jgi:hypothetical protein